MRQHLTFPDIRVLLATAVLAAACTESVGPERRGSPGPAFATSGSGIALDQVNGTLNERDTILVKGFNPTNPHVGDAIIATFFWVGANTITKVTDVLTTTPYTPVGNTYTLVESVTSGGISMATYVATNVQGFPDGVSDPSGAMILAVKASFALPVVDGGLLISAWTGVNTVTAQALGAHRSASGAGAGTTIADPGSIPVNAGALAYGVSMANVLAGMNGPAGFTPLITQSDMFIKGDGEYDAEFAINDVAGSVDPQWTWFFTLPSTWLASVLALNPAPPPFGNLTVTTTTTGSSLDADGYTVTVDGTSSQAIATNGSVTFTGLAAGSHSVALSEVSANCSVSNANPQTVSVPSGGRATVSFAVSCTSTTAGGNAAKMTGGGKLGDKRDFATFGFEAKPTGGDFEWVQHCPDGANPGSATCAFGEFTFKGKITPGTYSAVPGRSTCRTWSGTGTAKVKDNPSANGTYAFTVNQACDNGEPGHGTDFVDVTIDGYHASGYITGGNIQLHKDKDS